MFVLQYNKRLFPQKVGKKQKQKNIIQPIKKKLQKRLREYYRNLSEDEKIKKNNLTLELNISKYVRHGQRKKKRIY